ncbi:hypothetical protein [Actinocrispum sp. NPDC049592]|uniref:hypothetical protein n=1 Tax=Actinocrispum sp. NPDC049592 TaxID=3154835 RepID=UPI0034262BEF
MTDDQLEAALRDLGASIDVPDTPDVTASVRARISTKERRRFKLRPVLTTVVAILLAFAVALAVSPEVRAGVEQLLRFAGIEFNSEQPPPPLPSTTIFYPPGDRMVTLDEARRQAAFPVTVPKALGSPKEVHIGERFVSLVYDNARVDEIDGTMSPFMEKFTQPGQLEHVSVNGTTAYWVAAPHEVIYEDKDGATHTEAARLSEKTLVWQVGKVTYRLEGDFTREQAISIASEG